MSQTLNQIRASLLAKRKNPDNSLPEVSFLAMLISECEMIGKNKGNRDTTEDEVQSHLRKVMNNIIETMDYTAASKLWSLHIERQYIDALLPELVSEDELRTFMQNQENVKSIGQYMGLVKKKYGTRVDMKVASKIAQQLL